MFYICHCRCFDPGDWKSIQVNDSAGHVVHSCVVAVQDLVDSLLQGHIQLRHLQMCLKYKEPFKRLYLQCMNPHKLLHHKQPLIVNCGYNI